MSQDANSSIDDLFSGGGGADDPAARPASKTRVVAIRTLLLAACLAGFAWAGLTMSGYAVPVPFLFLVALVLVLLGTYASGVRPPPPPRAAGRHGPLDDVVTDGVVHVMKRWQTRLDWCQTDAGAFSRKIQPQLAEIIDERLRQRHGIIRSTEPHRAARVVGEPLWTFLTTPVKRPPSPRELANLIDQMEKI
ncbi:hypothetical protein F4553_003754 [Allocatelliglobosispora scoriae]|uniref:Uncharacterized protein n=1 Tax=Allocatelliglobosispora scoriae TaxID=643052 RepID=A0A841BRP0_9ACTN|nr:hypothetical protein [Allocatelliglobosispora scoriae]MBB5870375.1 hypothetical protein [Allocatelliglobosispora scoriae]